MFCPTCGSQVPDQTKFCPQCGKSCDAPASAPTTTTAAPAEPAACTTAATACATPAVVNATYGQGFPADFITAIKTCFSKYVCVKGRASRPEFWYFSLFTLLVAPPCAIIPPLILGVQIPCVVAGVRRLHDIGKSGWFMLLAPVPFAQLYLLYLLFQESNPAKNEFDV